MPNSLEKKAEPQTLDEFRAALAAKDEELRQAALLMREINHRVANSLQLAASILRMQANQETNHHTRDQLEKAGLRITSIQHVHSRLYRSGDLQTIELSQYLRDLCSDLEETVLQDHADQAFKLETESDRVRLATDFVSKIGLVVNEFVTNAFKHGHNDSEPSVIRVSAQLQDNVLRISVSDNGSGLPEDFDMTRIKGLGMRLVRFIATSLDGECGAYDGEKGGAVFFISLPLPEEDDESEAA